MAFSVSYYGPSLFLFSLSSTTLGNMRSISYSIYEFTFENLCLCKITHVIYYDTTRWGANTSNSSTTIEYFHSHIHTFKLSNYVQREGASWIRFYQSHALYLPIPGSIKIAAISPFSSSIVKYVVLKHRETIRLTCFAVDSLLSAALVSKFQSHGLCHYWLELKSQFRGSPSQHRDRDITTLCQVTSSAAENLRKVSHVVCGLLTNPWGCERKHVWVSCWGFVLLFVRLQSCSPCEVSVLPNLI